MKHLRMILLGLGSLVLLSILSCSEKNPVNPDTKQTDTGTFKVQGRFLYDSKGEKVILRGVNKMIYYRDPTGVASYPEITKCGANVVRIFWFARDDKTVAELNQTLTNCIKNKMIPIIKCHDATGEWDQLWKCVNNWRRPAAVDYK